MTSVSTKTDEAVKTVTVSYKGYRDGNVDFLGNQIEQMTGYTQQEFNSRTVRWTNLIHKEDLPAMTEIFRRALKGDKTYMREYRVTGKDGSFRWMQEWSHIVCDEKGSIEYVTGILIDVTEIKKAEAERLKCESRTGKYLTFALAGQEYGISIRKVKEIIELMPTTPVPQVHSYVKGIINLRGKVIPVVDLKCRLSVNGTEFTDRSCIIVVEIGGKAGTLLMGMMVDSVADVVSLRGEDIEDTPEFLEGLGADYFLGMAKTDKSLRPILDIDKVLEEVQRMGDEASP